MYSNFAPHWCWPVSFSWESISKLQYSSYGIATYTCILTRPPELTFTDLPSLIHYSVISAQLTVGSSKNTIPYTLSTLYWPSNPTTSLIHWHSVISTSQKMWLTSASGLQWIITLGGVLMLIQDLTFGLGLHVFLDPAPHAIIPHCTCYGILTNTFIL